MSEDKISVMLNNCVLWSAVKMLSPDSQKSVSNSLARNAADLLFYISDGFGFLLFARLLRR